LAFAGSDAVSLTSDQALFSEFVSKKLSTENFTGMASVSKLTPDGFSPVDADRKLTA